nr:immunoglobulin heavy chain junction region [Macaca mulatta]MOW45954.1 immunoglobulin heavy chain junction region [Macaca mulatta]MOW46257.1 immunoglobulin heavy chain junction region [Macaca mulatta]MOW46586.1 immunoglobulin heavy chain junction region [Macaca mulatta]MOW47477.1 immunoglobulin heavy chain junction region [Macaca mulatta]
CTTAVWIDSLNVW